MIVVHGFGPVYWGTEILGDGQDEDLDPRRFAGAWLVQDMPPYRRSIKGCRIRLSRYRYLHLGLCRKGENPHRPLGEPPERIGQWFGPSTQAAPTDGTGTDGSVDRLGSELGLGNGAG